MFLTIFTPIYNRQGFVNRLFNTVARQTCSDFEWIIIDDGSSDNTYSLLEKNKKVYKNLNVKIVHVENGGKQRAINKAVEIASGKYFLILDSDDLLTPDCVELLKSWDNKLMKEKDYMRYAGIAGLRKHSNGVVIGDKNKKEYIDATNLDRRKLRLLGDKAEAYKTIILKKYPFKVFKNENFVSEETVWNKIANDGYLIRWYMKAIYITDYLEDGLTANKERIDVENFQGLIYQTILSLEYKNLKEKLGAVGYLVYIGRIKKVDIKEISNQIHVPKLLTSISYILFKGYSKLKRWKKS